MMPPRETTDSSNRKLWVRSPSHTPHLSSAVMLGASTKSSPTRDFDFPILQASELGPLPLQTNFSFTSASHNGVLIAVYIERTRVEQPHGNLAL